MSHELEGTMYPNQLYLTSEIIVTPDGKEVRMANCYESDPLRLKDRAAHRMRLDEALFNFFGGVPSVENPLVLRIKGMLIDRCEDFNPGAAKEVLEGRKEGRFEDLSGRPVRILDERSKNSDYPYVGIVYDDDAEFPSCWGYDADGNCNDGVAAHRVVIMKETTVRPVRGAQAAPAADNNEESRED